MPATLLLDTVAWDLVVDANANIAVASEPYSLAQDAASYIQTFQGEVYYDTTVGVAYFSQILGQAPSVALLKNIMVDTADLVPNVGASQCFVSTFSQRKVSGQIQITETSFGQAINPPATATFTVINPQGV